GKTTTAETIAPMMNQRRIARPMPALQLKTQKARGMIPPDSARGILARIRRKHKADYVSLVQEKINLQELG
ncbi:MAG: hypothetical protein ACKO3B_02880, partial [Bacteroidota bacterium]